mgnify:FL=1
MLYLNCKCPFTHLPYPCNWVAHKSQNFLLKKNLLGNTDATRQTLLLHFEDKKGFSNLNNLQIHSSIQLCMFKFGPIPKHLTPAHEPVPQIWHLNSTSYCNYVACRNRSRLGTERNSFSMKGYLVRAVLQVSKAIPSF